MTTFVDSVSISVESGHGGAGASSFRREIYVPKGGPDGGDGGRGGDVVLVATEALQTLMDLKLKQHYKAKAGTPGAKRQQFGSDGEDCLIRVPCGTMIFDEDGEMISDLVSEGDRFIAAVGGKGGKGNKKFTNSVNRAPTYAQSGLPGEIKTIQLELRMLADVGLMGYPNAGKSTLLKTLTNANPKIANYPFTTLYPNLGILKFVDQEIVIADIPGLIEGASEGKGLGHDFLRHVDRTKLILHLIDVSSGDAEVCWKIYQALQKETKKSEYPISEKPQIVLLSKIDQVDEETLGIIQQFFSKKKVQAFPFSSFSKEGLDLIINTVRETLQKA